MIPKFRFHWLFLLLTILPCLPIAASSFLEAQFTYDAIGDAEITTPEAVGEEIGYHEGEVRLAVNLPMGDCHGLRFIGGWETITIDWSDNPHFHEEDFYYVNLGIGAYSFVIPDWRWVASCVVSIDPENTASNYMWYTLLLWGKYSLDCPCFCETSLHFGFYANVGIEESFILPILGFDVVPWEPWRLTVIFPLDMSLNYCVYNNVSLFAAVRGFRKRHRVGESEPLSDGVFRYRTLGYQFGVRYNNCSWINAELHFGYSTGGDLKIMDPKGNALIHYKTDSSMYAGGGLTLSY